MSLYRQPGQVRRRRRLAVAGAVALVAVVVVAVVLLAGAGGTASRTDRVQAARASASDALDGLEVLRIHYPQAVRAGRVADPAMYASTRANVARTRGELRSHAADLAVADPRAPRELDAAFARVAAAVDARATVPQFEAAVRAASATLSRVTGSS